MNFSISFSPCSIVMQQRAVATVANLVTNPFTSDVSGWINFFGDSSTLEWVSAGRAKITVVGAANARFYTTMATEIGAIYRVKVSAQDNVSNLAQLKIANSPGQGSILTKNIVGEADDTFEATSETTYLTLQVNTDGNSDEFFGLSVVEGS